MAMDNHPIHRLTNDVDKNQKASRGVVKRYYEIQALYYRSSTTGIMSWEEMTDMNMLA